jgi:Sulfotransferase family
MRNYGNGSTDQLRSRSRSNSFDNTDAQMVAASPLRGMKRIRNDISQTNNRQLHKNSNTQTSAEVSIANELSMRLNEEVAVTNGTTNVARSIRNCILIVAMILVLFQIQLLLLRSTTTTNMIDRFSNQNVHTINDNSHFKNVNIKSLVISSFVRPKQYDLKFKPLLNVQCLHTYNDTVAINNATARKRPAQQQKRRNNRIPSFIIAGAQKSGTSALYTMLPKMQRYTTKRVRRSNKFETHFFMHHANTLDNHALTEDDVCSLRQMYHREFISQNDTDATSPLFDTNLITFEKSPIYLCKPQLPSLIYQIVPWTKILLLLRNPIDRVFSQWKMEQARQFVLNYQAITKSIQNTTRTLKKNKHVKELKSFIDTIDDEVKMLRKYQLSRAPNLSVYVKTSEEQRKKVKIFRIPKSVDERVHGLQRSYLYGADSEAMSYKRFMMARPLSRGIYSQQVYFWLHPMNGGIGQYRINQNIKIIQYEKFISDRNDVLQDTMEFLGMPLRKYPNGTKVVPQHDLFDIDHSPGQYTLEERKSMWNSKTSKSAANPTFMNGTTSGKQYTTLDSIKDIVTLDDILNIKMDDIVREYLYKFYQPYNDELVLHLGNEWKNVWH